MPELKPVPRIQPAGRRIVLLVDEETGTRLKSGRFVPDRGSVEARVQARLVELFGDVKVVPFTRDVVATIEELRSANPDLVFNLTEWLDGDRSMDAAHIRALYQPLMGFLPIVGLGVVLVYGGVQTIDGAMTLGEFVAFYLYLAMLMVPFRSLGMLIGQAQRAVAGGTRIFEVLDTEPDVRDAPAAAPMPPGDGAIRLEGVAFAYDGTIYGGVERYILMLLRHFAESRYEPAVVVAGYNYPGCPPLFVEQVRSLGVPLLAPPHPGSQRGLSFGRGAGLGPSLRAGNKARPPRRA